MGNYKLWILLFFMFSASVVACQDEELSYLDVASINYPVNNLVVLKGLTLDDTIKMGNFGPQPSTQKARIKNQSPWIGVGFWGASVEGARPLTVTIDHIKVNGDNADASIAMQEIKVVGEGRIEIPYDNNLPIGEYLLSLKITNINSSKIVDDVFTVIVTDKKEDHL